MSPLSQRLATIPIPSDRWSFRPTPSFRTNVMPIAEKIKSTRYEASRAMWKRPIIDRFRLYPPRPDVLEAVIVEIRDWDGSGAYAVQD